MTANRRRSEPSPAELESARLRARGRDAIAKIITLESDLDDLALPELRLFVGILAWMADLPVGGAR